MEKVFIDKQKFDAMMDALTEKIKNSSIEFKGIYGIPKNGRWVGGIIAERLGIPLVDEASEGVLVVDDMSETGETLSYFPNNKKATILCHVQSKVFPDFYVDKIYNGNWIQFYFEEKTKPFPLIRDRDMPLFRKVMQVLKENPCATNEEIMRKVSIKPFYLYRIRKQLGDTSGIPEVC